MTHSLHAALRMLALSAVVCSPAVASAQTPADSKPADVKPGSYVVEPQHTQIEFAVSHMGFTTYFGRFSNASGTLSLKPKDPAGSTLHISVPADSISTTSGKLDAELKGDQWFNAAKYPQIVFQSTSVKQTGAGKADVMGQLTMHGVTRPVTLHAHFMGAGVNPLDKKYTVGFEASGAVKRSDFGINTYVPLIGDQVSLTLSGAFERQD